MSDAPPPNVVRIGDALAGAQRERKSGRDEWLGEGCPVQPLGMTASALHFLDTRGRLVEIPAGRLNGGMIQRLFAENETYLRQKFGKTWDDANRCYKSFDNARVAEALNGACSAEGDSGDLARRLRGRGVWLDADGNLVLHLGNQVVFGKHVRAPGIHDGLIYPSRPAVAFPHSQAQPSGPDGPAAELLDVLRQWEFRDQKLMPRMLLGWLCAAMLAGALTWRPMLWLNAPHGSGKSYLLKFIAEVLGDLGHKLENATAASVRGIMHIDPLALIIDEANAKEDNRQMDQLLDLVQISASGGVVARATENMEVRTFVARMITLFASVTRPPMEGQTQSRFALVALKGKPTGAPPLFNAPGLRTLGRKLFRRMIDRFASFPALFGEYRRLLLAGGMTGRNADQYGTLLACAELGLWDDGQREEERQQWVDATVLATAEVVAEETPEWRAVLTQIVTSIAPTWRGGEQQDIGYQIAVAAGRRVVAAKDASGDVELRRPGWGEMEEANRLLASLGLRVMPERDPDDQARRPLRRWSKDRLRAPDVLGDGEMVAWLAVANSHANLNSVVFRASRWAAKAGTSGVWKQALEQAPDARAVGAVKFGGVASRCVLVPIELALDADDGTEERE